MDNRSLWQKTATMPSFSPLSGDLTANVAIVGAGLCGVLTAYRLWEAGVEDIVVLDAGELGEGMTAYTTAKITAQHGCVYQRLLSGLGADRARLYADTMLRAVEAFRTLAKTLPDCDFENSDSVLYARTDSEKTKLMQECRAVKKLGMNAQLSADTELPFAVKQALWLPHQAQFHPLKFLSSLIKQLADNGVRFFTRSPVRYPESDNGLLVTPHGRLRASTVILASHYPTADRRGLYFARLYQQRGYLLSFQNAPRLQHMYRSVANNGGSFRSWQDQMIYGFGGHRTGQETTLEHFPVGEHDTAQWYPERIITARWSTQDVMTHDGMPFIGHFPAAEPRLAPQVLVATGFNRWGMTGSMTAAEVLSRIVTETPRKEDTLFSPHRAHVGMAAGSFLKENTRSLSILIGGRIGALPHNVQLLPPDEGGIFRIGGKRRGVYKDIHGTLYVVRPVCPHLGCPLRWNREEKTWDCPCHGSRFTAQGAVINTPAQQSLKEEPLP